MTLYHFLRLFAYTLAMFLISKPGKLIYIESFSATLFFSLVVGLVNMLIYPIFVLLDFPIIPLIFGLFLFVVNALMMILSALFIKDIHVNGFFRWVLASALISLVVGYGELFAPIYSQLPRL